MDPLAAYGWNSHFAQHLGADDCVPARVISEQRDRYWAVSASGELPVELSGRFRFEAAAPGDLPAVGDWLAVRLSPDAGMGIAVRVLPRQSVIARGTAGRPAQEQILAANVDTAFVVTTVDRDFNPRRMERYLSMIWSGGVRTGHPSQQSRSLSGSFRSDGANRPGVPGRGRPCPECAARSGAGFPARLPQTRPHVGHARFVRRGEVHAAQPPGRPRPPAIWETSVPADQRGRHTTSSRQMFLLPSGGLLIDTPGLRELQSIGCGSGLSRTFADVEALSAHCRFRDCRHRDEPECAVLEALRGGAAGSLAL